MAEGSVKEEGVAAEPVLGSEFFRRFANAMRAAEREFCDTLDRADLPAHQKRDLRHHVQTQMQSLRRRVERIAETGMVLREPDIVEFGPNSLRALAALVGAARSGDAEGTSELGVSGAEASGA